MLIRLHQSEIIELSMNKNGGESFFVINLRVNKYGEKALLKQLKCLIKKEAEQSCADKQG